MPSTEAALAAAAAKEERRAARKRAKKAVPTLAVKENDTDPDRPALKRLGEIPAFTNYSEAFTDLSGTGVAIPKVAAILQDARLPDYFGKGEDDEAEGFSNFTGADENTISNRLVPQTLDGGFDQTGVDKAGSGSLPAPTTSDNWKPATASGTTTAYTSTTDPKYALKPDMKSASLPKLRNDAPAPDHPTREAMMKKIQDLTRRLEDLEHQHPRNNQRELLIFIGTGLFVLISFDLAMRSGRAR